jgi:Cu-Zn family superoxide dismutase
MRVRYPVAAAALLGLQALHLSCAPEEEADLHEHGESFSHAVAVLSPTEGSEARGVVTFTQADAGISVVADLVGLEPGPHGFHIHEFGDCSASDGTSAGGHFNPERAEHAGPADSLRHVGDLGNIMADDGGAVHYEFTDTHIAFAGSNSIVGRGVIVHAAEDDLATQPTGAAGARVACGVVGIARQ